MEHLDPPFESADRRRLAVATGLNEQYLWQCLTGRREVKASEAMRYETLTGGELKRWHLCRRSWHLIWPDLMNEEGAPAPTPKDTEEAA
jgi:DNA-binding transcriptional regulator YdaS (Cro superfamily)